MNGIVLMADPRLTGIPVRECGDPLVDLRTRRLIAIDHRRRDPAGDWRQARSGLAQRLDSAARSLPAGVRLLHVEGYRPPALQARYFAEYRSELAVARPDLNPEALRRLTSRYVSPPEVAPHSAGAAVDLTLCDDSGIELDLGTMVNANPEQSAGGCYTAAENISATGRANRAVLAAAMTVAGFVNYPTEWWHWSYGDRYWALVSGAPAAIYGTLTRLADGEPGEAGRAGDHAVDPKRTQ